MWEEGNPRSVMSMVAPVVSEQIKLIPPDYLTMAETNLRKIVNPNEVDVHCREAFWEEYFLACDENRRMRMETIYGGYVSKNVFFGQLVRDAGRLAWMLRPPQDYMYRMKGLLELGLSQFEQILRMEITKKDTRLIGEIVRIVALLDNRVRGAVPQRLMVDSRSVSVNYEAPKSVKEIDAELKQLEREIIQLKGERDGEGSAELTGAREVDVFASAPEGVIGGEVGERGEFASFESEALHVVAGVSGEHESHQSVVCGEPDREEFGSDTSEHK